MRSKDSPAEPVQAGSIPAAGDRSTPAPETLATQVWQPRKVLEMNVFLLRNRGLDLQRWFEREVQALTGPSLRDGQTC